MRHVNLAGEIGCEWDGFTASDVTDALQEAADAGDDVTFHVNSPGGNVADAVMIDAMLRTFAHEHPELRAVAEIDGMAASAASFAFLSASRIVAHNSSTFMVHDPSCWGWGNADEMRRLADALDKCKAAIVAAYVRRTGRYADEVERAMADETWFTAEEAVAWGLADELLDDGPEGISAAESTRFDSRVAAVSAGNPARCDTGCTIANGPQGEDEPEAGAAEGEAGGAPVLRCLGGRIYRFESEE